MTETFNEIVNNHSFEKVGSRTVIQQKNFSNEVICSHSLIGLTFSHLIFINCNFTNIDFRYGNFNCCEFTNCNFTDILFNKSELDGCNFKNCKIFKSDFRESNFIASYLIDCQFNDVHMGGAVFTECEFIKPKFNKQCHLNSLTLFKSKIWDSKKCIEVNAFDNIPKIIDELEDY